MVLIIILLLFLIILVFLITYKFEINSNITIKAPKELIWKNIIDLPGYNEWNSQLQYINGKVLLNASIKLKLSTKLNSYEFQPKITSLDKNKKFTWKAKTILPFVFDGEHTFLIEEHEGKTILINKEKYSGLLSFFLEKSESMKQAPKGFDNMNLEFKKYIENQVKNK